MPVLLTNSVPLSGLNSTVSGLHPIGLYVKMVDQAA
jgi:hypothetical protein